MNTTSNLSKPRPDVWREGALFGFIEEAWNNCIAVVGNKNVVAQRLVTIDSIFEDLRIGFKPSNVAQLVPAFLAFRSFSAFRASVMVGLCMPTDSYALQRSCLESAGYAKLIASIPELAELWLRRDEDAQAKSRFTNRGVREAIEKEDQQLAKIYQELYERSIEFGAHPNEKSVTTGIIRESLDTKEIKCLLLPGDGLPLDHALRNCAQVGICALKVLSTVFPEQFERIDAKPKIDKAALPF